MATEIDTINSALAVSFDDVFNPEALAGDLTDGAGTGFQVVSIRGSKWRVKVSGEEKPILNEDDEPVPTIEAVLLKANKAISKIYYATKYTEGDDEAPDCFSVDGVKPDASSTNKQAESCAACPHNIWGSRITESGKKAKECQDNRRVAIWLRTPIEGVDDSEPMLLRIPAASLSDLATYGSKMAAKNFPYNRVVTRIGFDLNASYPKLTFKAIRPVPDGEEANEVVRMFNSEATRMILNTASETAPAAPAPVGISSAGSTVDTEFEEPEPPKEEKKAAPKKVSRKKKKAAAKPEPEKQEGTSLDSDLEDIIADLENLA